MTQESLVQATHEMSHYAAMTTSELRSELVRRIGLSVENLCHAASIWSVLSERGEDLSDLKDSFAIYLPRIADGSLLPQLVAGYVGQPRLLKRLAQLPVAEQRKLADGEPVPFVVKDNELRMLPLRVLSTAQIDQVLGEKGLRGEREQIAYLASSRPRWKARKPVIVGNIKADPVAGTVTFGKHLAVAEDVIGALRSAGMIE